MTPDSWRFESDRKTVQYKSAVGTLAIGRVLG